MRPTVGQVLKVGKIWGTITKVSRRSCAVRLVTGEVVEIDVRTLPPGAAFDAPDDTAKPDVRQQQRHVVYSDYSQEANTFASTTLGETSICSRAELRLGGCDMTCSAQRNVTLQARGEARVSAPSVRLQANQHNIVIDGVMQCEHDIVVHDYSGVYCNTSTRKEVPCIKFNGESGITCQEIHVGDLRRHSGVTTSIDRLGVHTKEVWLPNGALEDQLAVMRAQIEHLHSMNRWLFRRVAGTDAEANMAAVCAAQVARSAAHTVAHLAECTESSR